VFGPWLRPKAEGLARITCDTFLAAKEKENLHPTHATLTQTTPLRLAVARALTLDSPSYSPFGHSALSPVGPCPNPEPGSKNGRQGDDLDSHVVLPTPVLGTKKASPLSRQPKRSRGYRFSHFTERLLATPAL